MNEATRGLPALRTLLPALLARFPQISRWAIQRIVPGLEGLSSQTFACEIHLARNGPYSEITTGQDMTPRIDQDYGPFRIIAAHINGRPKGAAYLNNLQNFTSEGESLDEVAQDLRTQIDAFRARRDSARTNGLPRPEEFEAVLSDLGAQISGPTRRLLRIHLGERGAEATLPSLARMSRLSIANVGALYGATGQTMMTLLEYLPPIEKGWGLPHGVFAICTVSERDNEILLSLRPQILSGLRGLLSSELDMAERT